MLQDVKKKYPSAKIGEVIRWEVTPSNFGRIAAQAAKQTIMQQLRKAEKAIVKEEFETQVGEIVGGIVRRFEAGGIVVDFGKAEGILSARDKMPGDIYSQGERISALLKSVEISGAGPSLILTRTSPEFVTKLFERESSEIHDGIVKIRKIAREPGLRSKIAVSSSDPNIDPIGACVGMKGMRVKNVTSELNGEKIDIVEYDDNVSSFAIKAFQPAQIKKIDIDEASHTLNITVAPDQLSLAIGKKGQNVRLTTKLIEWKVNIWSEEESNAAFQVQINDTIKTLSEVINISEKSAKLLVGNGYLTLDGIKAADLSDITKIKEISEEDIEKIKELKKN
jgi:N utilization substance protein A